MSVDELRAAVVQLKENREVLFNKQKEISTKIKELISQIGTHRELRDGFTSSVREQKEKRDELNAKIKELILQIKETQPKEKRVETSSSHINVRQVLREIKAIERKIETEANSFDKETQLMKALKEKKKQINSVKVARDAFSASGKIGKDLSKLKKDADAIHAIIQEKAENSQKEHELLLGLSKQIDALKEEEKEIRVQIDKVKADLRDKIEQLRPFMDEKKVQQTIAGEHRHKREVEMQKKTAEKIEKQAEVVEEKIKGKLKLTTEDLLAFQSKEVLEKRK